MLTNGDDGGAGFVALGSRGTFATRLAPAAARGGENDPDRFCDAVIVTSDERSGVAGCGERRFVVVDRQHVRKMDVEALGSVDHWNDNSFRIVTKKISGCQAGRSPDLGRACIWRRHDGGDACV